MIKFALNIKLRYMLRKVLSLLFFIGFLANGNLIAQTNLFTNGSLDSPSGGSFTNWRSHPTSFASPDINNISSHGPATYTIANDDNFSSSTNGGTWFGGHDNTNSGGNTPPVANNDGNSLDEGGMAIGNVLNNDSDTDGDIIIIISNTLPSHGTIVLLPSGEYEYLHNGDEEFADEFEYTISDGTTTATATVFFTINPINDIPVVVKDTFEVNEGDTLTVLNSNPKLIVNNDYDPDNLVSDFTVIPHIPPIYGDLKLLGIRGAFQYIHECNDASMDVFRYYVSDGIDTSLVSDSVIIFIKNEPPIGHPDTFAINVGGTLSIDNELDGLLKNDVDSFACDILSVKIIKEPSMHLGTFTLNPDGTFLYIHDGSFIYTQDTIIYSLFDGDDFAVENDTVYINIVYPPPSTTTLSYAVDEAKQLVVDSAQGIFPFVSGNNGLPISVEWLDDPSILNGPFRGQILPSGEINDDGSFVYEHDCTDTPNEDWFLYKVEDSLSYSIDTVKITVNNICPEGLNDLYEVIEGQTIDIAPSLGVLSNDTDDNHCDNLTATIVNEPLYHSGTFTLNSDGSFIYIHDDSENFTDQFSYRLSDGECNGDVYVVNLEIEPVDDKPPIANDDSFTPCLKEGETLVISTYEDGVLGNDVDPDIKDSVLILILTEDVLHGKLTLNDDGTFTYIHDGGEDDFDFFKYVATDGDFVSDTAVVTICIDLVNDCPDAVDDYFIINEGETLDTTVVRNDTDEDLVTTDNNYVNISAPSVGTLQMRTDGSFVYISPNQIPQEDPLIVTFEYEITDPDPSTSCYDKATVTIRINSINDCPVAFDDTIFVDALNNELIVKDIIANDIDVDNPLDSSSIFIIDPPKYGDLEVNDDGTISYNYIGSPTKKDSITYVVQDSLGCISNYAKVLISIENIQFPEYELPSYFTPNQDRFNDFFTIKYKNIILGNVRFEVKIVDRYQRIVFEGDVYNDRIWDGIDINTTGDAKKGLYFYEITPIEYGDIRARTLVGVIFLDR